MMFIDSLHRIRELLYQQQQQQSELLPAGADRLMTPSRKVATRPTEAPSYQGQVMKTRSLAVAETQLS